MKTIYESFGIANLSESLYVRYLYETKVFQFYTKYHAVYVNNKYTKKKQKI